MDGKGWRSKGDLVPRRSPRQQRKTCGRPFSAPRQVRATITKKPKTVQTNETQDSDVRVLTASEIEMIQSMEEVVPEVSQDSQVKIITETENDRDLQEREAPALETDALSDLEDRHETVSNTTESTPDILKSPERQETADKASDILMTVVTASEVEPQTKAFKYQGVSLVEETQLEDSSGNSDDDTPIVSTLIQEKGMTLSRQQIEDCKEGPIGERAVGVTISKTFDGVKYTGTIDSFRLARKRFYYHVTYSDGDEEELSQTELRDGYVLGLTKEIEELWQKYMGGNKETESSDKDETSQGESSGDEGSDYGNKEFNDEVRGKRKKRKENRKRSKPQKNNELSDTMLPKPGDKNVSAEAFAQLDDQQKLVVAEKVNRKTKKVICFFLITISMLV